MFTSRLFGGTPSTSSPCRTTCRAVGSSKPAIIRMVVVLPQPDGPSSEKNSPSRDRQVDALDGLHDLAVRGYSLRRRRARSPGAVDRAAVVRGLRSWSSFTSCGLHGRGGLVADVVHDVLDPGVVLEAVHRQVLAVPGVLEAAVRHLRRRTGCGC